jgi:hypothetical protein
MSTKTMGTVADAFLTARTPGVVAATMRSSFSAYQLSRKLGETFSLRIRKSILDDDILSFNIANLSQSLPEASSRAATAEA